MHKFYIAILMLFFSSFTYAINPPSIVYRCDTRTIDEINAAGGFFPNDSSGIRNYDLMNHFEGMEGEGYVSGLVSVSYTLRHVVNHCIGMVMQGRQAYIYMIVPGGNFYNVSASLNAARNSLPAESIQRASINYLIDEYDTMDEYVARDGFPVGRVLNYAVLDEDMIDEYYNIDPEDSELYIDAFWESRWVHNRYWNDDFDGEVASSDIYPVVNEPASAVVMALANHNIEIPIRFLCQQAPAPILKQLKSLTCQVFPIVKRIVDLRMIYILSTK